jgi:hypothetical protein
VGRPRPQKPPKRKQQRYSDAEYIAAIAALLGGAMAVQGASQAIAAILWLAIDGLGLSAEAAQGVANAGATLALEAKVEGEGTGGSRTQPRTDSQAERGTTGDSSELRGSGREDGGVSGDGGAGDRSAGIASPRSRGSGAQRSELLLRASFTLNATRRIARRVLKGSTLRDAIVAEGGNLKLHLAASRQRAAGKEALEAMSKVYGTRHFVWHHSKKVDFRPTHKAADGKVFDLDDPPRSTNGLPGTLPECGCWSSPAPSDEPVTLR